MLKLFFSEWRYNRNLAIFEGVSYLSVFIFLMRDEYNNYNDVFAFMMFSMFWYFFVMIPVSMRQAIGEKRPRLEALLPLSVKTLGRYYLFGLILYNSLIFILWIIFYLIKYTQPEPGLIWTMLSFSMHIYIIFLLFVIGGQYGHYFKKFREIVAWLTFISSVSLCIFSIGTVKDTYSMKSIESLWLKTYLNLIKSPSGALFMILLAGLMLFLFYKLHVNRKYYLIIK